MCLLQLSAKHILTLANHLLHQICMQCTICRASSVCPAMMVRSLL